MKTAKKEYKCDWPIMSLFDINNIYGNDDNKFNPKVQKVSSWMFAGTKTWDEFCKCFSDFPAEKQFRVLYKEPLKELCITTVD